MTRIKEALKAAPAGRRVSALRALPDEALALLAQELEGHLDTYAPYRSDPVAFVTDALNEDVWSKQVEILNSVRDNKRTAVPACHAPGKSHIAARAIAWWVATHMNDDVRVVTTATTFRQVRGILWPHIRKLVAAHDLPGEVLTTEWKINDLVVADGFSPADHNEAAVQGIHAEYLLIVVDEAGGISNTIGQALEALMTGENTRLLLLGNPPTDQTGSWFERACASDLYNVIPIPAAATPNFTGEKVGPWARNLVDQRWVDEVTQAFGPDSPFVQARVQARFPRSVASAVIPIDWVEAAQRDPAPGGPIRLGVDVAADGGDEFAIAEADGMNARIVHTSRGNSSPVEVAGRVLEAIRAAEAIHAERGYREPVRVKIDAIGVGWGVAGLLEDWGKEGRHAGIVVAVNVSQAPHDRDKFANQRAELWWNARELLQPDENDDATLVLDVDRLTALQLAAPSYRSNSSGRIQIEGKAEMSKRGVGSPDRAEAVLLALFEPPRREIPEVAPLSLPGTNSWI
ncbi:MAG TPA: hypothetical protein VIG24_19420 [Acidimicrobiia bacterium]